MNRQKKYRWKVLHRVLKETIIDKKGFIHLPRLIGSPWTDDGYPYLPATIPPYFFLYLTTLYGLQKNESKLFWRKYSDKINKLIK